MIDTTTCHDVTFDQSDRSCPYGLTDLSTRRRLPVAICRVCAADDQLRDRRCPACNAYWREHGIERPDDLILKAALRHDQRQRQRSITLDDSAEEAAMTRATYSPLEPPADCACGCGRLANPLDLDGLSKLCADLRWYRSQIVRA